MSLKFTDENPNRNDLLNKIEQHYRQLLAESKSNEVCINTFRRHIYHYIFIEFIVDILLVF